MSEMFSKLNQIPFPELEKKLADSLHDLLACLEWGTLPAQEMCLEALDTLNAYMMAPKPSPYVNWEKTMGFHTTVGASRKDIPASKTLLEEASQIPGGWAILFRLGLEKLIPTEAPCFQTPAGLKLIGDGYVVPIQITAKDYDQSFFTLSEKGWACHRTRKAHIGCKKSDSLLQQIPKGMVLDTAYWNPVTILRALLLYTYFSREPAAGQFLLFPHPEVTELLLGCRVDKAETVEYVCACVFQDQPSAKELQVLADLAHLESVDRLTLLFLRKEDEALVRDGLSDVDVLEDPVQFQVMEVSHE